MYGDASLSYSNVSSSFTPATQTEVATGSRLVTGSATKMQERVQSSRKVSSTIVDVQYLGPMPQDSTREIEVQGEVQEVVRNVSKKEIIETIKTVPRVEIEWVEKIVDKPVIQWVTRDVEVPKYQEVIKTVPKVQIVEQPREVIKTVRKPVVRYVEQTKEVPGEIIEIEKRVKQEELVEYNRYNDKPKPVVVAQTVRPSIVEGGEVEVEVLEYLPECRPVEISVLKGVSAAVSSGVVTDSFHRVICVPAAQYNTLLKLLNPHLSSNEQNNLPFLRDTSGTVVFSERVTYADPLPDVHIMGYDPVHGIQPGYNPNLPQSAVRHTMSASKTTTYTASATASASSTTIPTVTTSYMSRPQYTGVTTGMTAPNPNTIIRQDNIPSYSSAVHQIHQQQQHQQPPPPLSSSSNRPASQQMPIQQQQQQQPQVTSAPTSHSG